MYLMDYFDTSLATLSQSDHIDTTCHRIAWSEPYIVVRRWTLVENFRRTVMNTAIPIIISRRIRVRRRIPTGLYTSATPLNID